MPNPTYNNPDAGICSEGSTDPGTGGGSRVQGVEHYKIKTVAVYFKMRWLIICLVVVLLNVCHLIC